ncbi:MAG: DNA methyltransferase [Planctomycetota bacterium]
MRRRLRPTSDSALLPFGALLNCDLFSNHWLEYRLLLEPEWTELRAESDGALAQATDLWRQERDRVEQYGSEASLEQAFIQPLFEILGWKLIYQTWLQNRKPDYALFLDDPSKDAALAAGRNAPDFWQHPAILADAKAWHVNLDRPIRVGSQREYPPEQIEWYLDRSRLSYAILTNGRLWRLIPRQLAPGKARFQTYLEVDLPRLLEARMGVNGGQRTFDLDQATAEEFFRFYLFFSPRAFESRDGRLPLVERALSGSSEYALSVGEDLKERVFEALRLCIEGFLIHQPNGLDPVRDLEMCREQSFVLLYRLLFIMYAEDRALLPYRRNDVYTRNRSLARHRDEIAELLDRIDQGRQPDYPPDQISIWSDLLSLFDLIDRGHARYDVPAYNGGLFDPGRHSFLTSVELPDRYLARVIDHLGRAEDPQHSERGLFRVDYRDLAIQNLGSIYEGLLELRPHFATEPMIVIRERRATKSAERIIPESGTVPSGWEATNKRYNTNEVYLQTDKGERRATGSYYTPDQIVAYIVDRTLGPLCRDLSKCLSAEVAAGEEKRKNARGANREALDAQLDKLRQDFDDRVLRLRVCDPAMGSGHFLVRATQYLAEEIATNPYTGDPDADQLQEDESVLTYWKRRVVESCIFGVDLNPMAVELAKLALWLETVSADAPLSFLDHHLRPGNSLIGARVAELGALPGAMELQQNVFKQQVEQQLPVLLEPLIKIREMPSQTAQQIKDKEKLYRRTFQPLCQMFETVADLWCSTFFAHDDQAVTPEQYQQALQALQRTADFKKLVRQPWFGAAIEPVRARPVAAFQWELEFPEVFFDISRQERDASFHRGFDAVIGNPPYDVLAERELTRDLPDDRAAQVRRFLSSFKDLIDAEDMFRPSRRGKNNLYKLFICRALDLLAEGGRFGFIVPMALLGDDQAADIRAAMLDAGAFTSVDAFPQKDDPTRRVFPEAKLSTTVFTTVKTADEHARQRPFTARQHPAAQIQDSSPSLTLQTDHIPLYDPSNRSIVSCSQDDWDLAVKIMAGGRMTRFGEFVQFSQGEVNETVQRRAGTLMPSPSGARTVMRGANICLYILREASQGRDIYLNAQRFLRGKGEDTKAFHHRYNRVGLQESCPQNNFRRIIASFIPAGEYCNHKVNYIPQPASQLPLELDLALLNSKLADWYFRLGSTNAAVSHYQLHNLPCPVFADQRTGADDSTRDAAFAAIYAGKPDVAFAALAPALARPPFPLAIQNVLVELVRRIIAIEQARGEIARTQRSHLADAAQPLQDLIDRILYALAGLTPAEITGLEDRLTRML